MARGECTSGSPLASSSSQAKSCASEMISENAVRITVSHISSTTVTSRLHMISSEIGSASIRAIASASGVPGATSACGGAATPIASRRLRLRVDRAALSPGGTTVVASRSSTIAGPSIRSPGTSA